jgi:hypothetical protein
MSKGNLLRRTKRFVQTCILCPRRKREKEKTGIDKKLYYLPFRSLTSNGGRGALINTVEHPLPVLTSPRSISTFKFAIK